MLGLEAGVATRRASLLGQTHRVRRLGAGLVCLPKADWIARLGAGVESVGRVRFHAKCVSCRCLEGLEPASWERDTSFGKPNVAATEGCSNGPIEQAATKHRLLLGRWRCHLQTTIRSHLSPHSQMNGHGGCASDNTHGCFGRCGFPIQARVGCAKKGWALVTCQYSLRAALKQNEITGR